jgi:hypothetical protein
VTHLPPARSGQLPLIRWGFGGAIFKIALRSTWHGLGRRFASRHGQRREEDPGVMVDYVTRDTTGSFQE